MSAIVRPQFSDLAKFMEVINEVIPLRGAKKVFAGTSIERRFKVQWSIDHALVKFRAGDASALDWLGEPFQQFRKYYRCEMPAAFTPLGRMCMPMPQGTFPCSRKRVCAHLPFLGEPLQILICIYIYIHMDIYIYVYMCIYVPNMDGRDR